MITAGERLALLSGLSGATAAQHLARIAALTGQAGNMLANYSTLGTATAAEHLLYERALVVPSRGAGRSTQRRDKARRRAEEEVLLLIL